MNDPLNFYTRREFLRRGTLGGALAATVPGFLARTFASMNALAADSAIQTATGKDAPILVLLQLAGGNDGLNTVVPFTNDYYAKARPRLGLAPDKVLKLNDEFGLHPGLTGFKELFDAGQLAVAHGVGYPNPNRSHFRSTEIWQTASDAQQVERYGWLGRYFDNACAGADPAVGISLGKQAPQAFAGPKPLGVSLDNPESYRFVSGDRQGTAGAEATEMFYKELNHPEMASAETSAGSSIGMLAGKTDMTANPLDFLERTALDAQLSSEKIREIAKKGANTATYPASGLSNSLRLVARLIAGGMPTRVYYVSQGGFDTHTNQFGTHDRLMRELGDGVGAFIKDLKGQGNLDRVLLMTFSEFGRRVSENASGGTDHGAAAPLFLLGSKVKAGFIGKPPSLAPGDLQQGDPKFSTDFRSIYAGVLERWLKTPSKPILGRQFEPISFT